MRPFGGYKTMQDKELIQKAIEVLKNNDIDGKSTKAAPKLYPHQWLWDSCFIAIGYRHFEPARAMNEIRGLLESQWENGMLPHIKFNKKEDGHRRENWRTEKISGLKDIETSGISQPPMLAIAVWEIYRKKNDKNFLKEVFPKIKKYHQYLKEFRELNNSGLVFIVHPWESGLDNSPRWDTILDNMRLTHIPKYRRFDTDFVPIEQRPTDKEYDRYWYLVKLLVDCNYDIKKIIKYNPFIVEAVLFNSIWCEANRCLSEIAKEIGEENKVFEEWAAQTRNSINKKLYDENDNLYYDFDIKSKTLIREQTSASFMPLFAKVASQGVVQKMVTQYIINRKKYWLDYPLPTVSADSKKFNPKGYWRGPVWINMNWFIAKGLANYGFKKYAAHIKNKSIELVSKSGFREYFNPNTGEGYGAADFSWSAALVLDMLLD